MNLVTNRPKVALLGLILESNRFARPAQREDFLSLTCLRAKSLIGEANASNPSLAIEFASFVKTMNASGEWEPYPIILMASRPLGPIPTDVFEAYCAEVVVAFPEDIYTVYLCQHGDMVAENIEDADGNEGGRISRKDGED